MSKSTSNPPCLKLDQILPYFDYPCVIIIVEFETVCLSGACYYHHYSYDKVTERICKKYNLIDSSFHNDVLTLHPLPFHSPHSCQLEITILLTMRIICRCWDLKYTLKDVSVEIYVSSNVGKAEWQIQSNLARIMYFFVSV